ncbi:DUF1992 domain-containing protein [Actinomycetospora sp. TBRC 11914]|uniref:DnaJ family domain-containing protein n=1 Tax=Actinomycetospora sp. TBRC 11914 TaxID=2729387 RepID=UPI00145ED714|nr:DUF1992 domain-containing protein [Actinomycetospora sp. TBRC 11914]NMO92623.1 DUF1992 domain-containing protein [Actinomycetospora sp. TBRC 11914]
MRGDGEAFRRRYESIVDEQIRTAIESGQFDDLPGAGKPLRLPAHGDENWWIRSKLRSEGVPTDALLPPSLRLRKEIEGLDAAVRELRTEAEVRAVVAELDRRVVDFLRVPSGPRVPVRRPSADAVVARWRAAREEALAAAPPRPEPPAPAGRRPWWRRLRRGPHGT